MFEANRNTDNEKFPLHFAKRIAVACGIWKSMADSNFDRRYEQNEKLKEFQQMSITCSFENSLIAFHGDELEDNHLDGLKIIHGATKSWLRGEVVGTLMSKINDKKITNRDFAASISIILDQLETTEKSSDGKTNNKKELVIRMSKMQDVVELTKKD